MKRMLLAATTLASLAISQPSMAEGCIAGDSEHNNTIMSKLEAINIVLMTTGKEIRATATNELDRGQPSEKTLQRLRQNTALLTGLREAYNQCQKIMEIMEAGDLT